MKKAIIFCISWIFVQTVFAQQTEIKRIAKQMADGLVTQNYQAIIDHTEPQAVAAAGGLDSMKKAISTLSITLKEQGLTIDGAEVGDPGEIYKLDSGWFCVVPEVLKMGVPKTDYRPKGVLTSPSTISSTSE